MNTISLTTTDHANRPMFLHTVVSPADVIREVSLIQRCKDGDAVAWDTLIGRYEKFVYKSAYNLCRNQEDAEDITGEVFLLLYRKLHTFRGESRFASWLFRIVRNTYLTMCVRPSHRRHLSLETGHICDLEPSVGFEIMDTRPSPEALYIENEMAQMLAKSIHHLPIYQQQVLWMYHIEGKSYEEVALATNLSIGTVKSRLSRARNMLRQHLTPFQEILMERSTPTSFPLENFHLVRRTDFTDMTQSDLG